VIARRQRRLVALANHDPADIFEHRRAVLIVAGGPHINDAGLAARILLKPDDLGLCGERIAGIDRLAEAAIGVPQIGDRIEGDVRHRFAEHDVKDQ
jgi:hypothetical protein